MSSTSDKEKIRESVSSHVQQICDPFENFQATVFRVEESLPYLRKNVTDTKDSINRACNVNLYTNYAILAGSVILAPVTFGLSIDVIVTAAAASGIVSLAKNAATSYTCNGKYVSADIMVKAAIKECENAKKIFIELKTSIIDLGKQLITLFPKIKNKDSPELLGWNYFYQLATGGGPIQTDEEFSKSISVFEGKVKRQDNTLLDISERAFEAYRTIQRLVTEIDETAKMLTIYLKMVEMGDALYNAGRQYLEKCDELTHKLNKTEKKIEKMKEHHITLNELRKIPVLS